MVFRTLLLPILIVSALLAGCGDQRQRQFRQEKRQFAIVMKSKVNQFERRAADLATQVQDDSLLAIEVGALRGSHGEFREEIAAINQASEKQWKEMKPAMEAAYFDLERRYYEIAGAAASQEALEATADTLITAAETEGTVAEGAPAHAESPADSVAMPLGQ